MSENKRSLMTVNFSVTDTEIFKGLLELVVELSHQLDEERGRYFVDKLNELLGERYFEIDYKDKSK